MWKSAFNILQVCDRDLDMKVGENELHHQRILQNFPQLQISEI